MSDAIRPQPGILEIAPYQGGVAHLPGRRDVIKLSSNENPFGPSERVQEAIQRALRSLHRYPSTDHAALRTAIATAWTLDADRIICGVGSDEIITLLCHAYAGPGDEVIHTEHGFLMYRISALAAGATPVEVPERDRTTDVDAILAACGPRTKLVFIANPNNPTGTMIPAEEVQRLADGLPPQALLVLDGAYAEYVDGYDGGAGLVEARENVVMTRTFSKIYGLGGLRIGWGYGPNAVIDVLNRVRGPFNLSTIQLEAAAAAVADSGYMIRCRDDNTRMRVWLAEALRAAGVACDDSQANFVLARFASPDLAGRCDAKLREAGLIVRSVAGYKLPHCLRITIGDEPACRQIAYVVARFMAAEGGSSADLAALA